MKNALLEISLSLIIASPVACLAQNPQDRPEKADAPAEQSSAATAPSAQAAPAAAAMSMQQLQQALLQNNAEFAKSIQQFNSILAEVKDAPSAKLAISKITCCRKTLVGAMRTNLELQQQPQFEQLDEAFLKKIDEKIDTLGEQSTAQFERLMQQNFYDCQDLVQELEMILRAPGEIEKELKIKRAPKLSAEQIREQFENKAREWSAITTQTFALLDKVNDKASAQAAARPVMNCYKRLRAIMQELELLAEQEQFDKLDEQFLDMFETKIGSSLQNGAKSVERLLQQNCCYDCEELSEALRLLCTIEI